MMIKKSLSASDVHGMPCTLSQWDGSDQQSLGTAHVSKVTCMNIKEMSGKVGQMREWASKIRCSFFFPFFFLLFKQACKSER